MDFEINPLTMRKENTPTPKVSSFVVRPEVSVICVGTLAQGNSFIPLGMSITAG